MIFLSALTNVLVLSRQETFRKRCPLFFSALGSIFSREERKTRLPEVNASKLHIFRQHLREPGDPTGESGY